MSTSSLDDALTEIEELVKYIYTPAEIARLGIDAAKREVENRHRIVPFPVQGIDNYLLPLHGGMLAVILAQTHNWKTGLIYKWEKELCKYLAARGREEVVIHVDVETTIDDQASTMLSSYGGSSLNQRQITSWEDVKANYITASIEASRVPLYRIGVRAGHGDFNMLYMTNVMRMIAFIQGKDPKSRLLDREVKIAAIFMDYLQAFPVDPRISRAQHKDQRRLQVAADVENMRNTASIFDAPVIIGCQAKQELKNPPGKNMLLPGVYDAVETMYIGTRTDVMVSQWMPKTTHTVGDTISHKSLSFKVTEDLLWFRVLKQRRREGAQSGRSWPLYIDFENDTIRQGIMLPGNRIESPY